jgi:ABC-type lipoprotein release transport system permease subunit
MVGTCGFNLNYEKRREFMKFTKTWLGAAGIRCLRTAGQTAAALIATSFLITDVNWLLVASATGMAVVLSFLTSLGSLPEAKLPEPEYAREGTD